MSYCFVSFNDTNLTSDRKNSLLDSSVLIACYKMSVTRGKEPYDAHYFLKPSNILRSLTNVRTQRTLRVGEIHLIKMVSSIETIHRVAKPLNQLSASSCIPKRCQIKYSKVTVRSVIQSFLTTRTNVHGNASRDIRVYEISFLRNRRWIHLSLSIRQGIYWQQTSPVKAMKTDSRLPGGRTSCIAHPGKGSKKIGRHVTGV